MQIAEKQIEAAVTEMARQDITFANCDASWQKRTIRAALEAALSTDAEPVKTASAVAADLPLAATEKRDVDEVDVTGWGVLEGHAIPISVARKLATRINLCIRSALSAQVQDVAVPDGWQLVPKEPTEEMIAEACSSAPHVIITYTKPEERDGTIPLIPLATWRAMLAAAPAKQEGQP